MRFFFKPKVTIVCILLMLGMIRLSVWQWHRHLWKIALIEEMDAHLAEAPVPLPALIDDAKKSTEPDFWGSTIHRRVIVDGTYDFEHEMVLRNRRYENAAGMHVLTPLHISGTNSTLIVDRGFIPLSQSEPEQRKKYRAEDAAHFVGLVKESNEPYWIAPQDPPTGTGLPWVDAWLRVDIQKISKQLPYSVLPVYVEIMDTTDPKTAESEIVKSSNGREELLIPGMREEDAATRPDVDPNLKYPVPSFDPVTPPDIHLGYVYEWAIMAAMTCLIGFVLQLRPPRQA